MNTSPETEKKADMAAALLDRMLDPLGLSLKWTPGERTGTYVVELATDGRDGKYKFVWFHSSRQDKYFGNDNEWHDSIEFSKRPEPEDLMSPENAKYLKLALLQYLGHCRYDRILARDQRDKDHTLIKFGTFTTLPELAINLDLVTGGGQQT